MAVEMRSGRGKVGAVVVTDEVRRRALEELLAIRSTGEPEPIARRVQVCIDRLSCGGTALDLIDEDGFTLDQAISTLARVWLWRPRT